MKCQDVCKNLSAYLDGELDKGEASIIATHLMACNHCRNEWEQLNKASVLLRELPEIEPPPEFMLGLSEKLATMPVVVANEENISLLHRVQRMVKKPWYTVAAAAAMFGLAFGVTHLWDNGNGNILNHPAINKTVVVDKQPKNSNNGNHMPAFNGDNNEQQLNDVPAATNQNQPDNEQVVQEPTEKGNGGETPTKPQTGTEARTESVDKASVTVKTLAANVYTLSIQIKVADDNVSVAAQKVKEISTKYHGNLQENGNEFTLKFPRQGTDISLLLPEFNNVGEVSTVPMKDVIGEYKAQINNLEQKKEDLTKQLGKTENPEKIQEQINQTQNEINNKLAEVKELSNYINIIVKLVA
jgi:negative regulator of sigma E activity